MVIAAVKSKQTALRQAQQEIRNILNQYGLAWREVAPDVDEEIWQEMEPEMRAIRRKLFRQRYPQLYAGAKFS